MTAPIADRPRASYGAAQDQEDGTMNARPHAHGILNNGYVVAPAYLPEWPWTLGHQIEKARRFAHANGHNDDDIEIIAVEAGDICPLGDRCFVPMSQEDLAPLPMSYLGYDTRY